MKTAKQEGRHHISCLPDDAQIEDVLYRLDLVFTLNERLRHIDDEELIPQEEVEKRMAKWVKSAGR